MAERPQRIRVLDEAGRSVTLDEGPGAFECLGLGPQVLFLGLGPRPELLARWFPEARAGALYV
ncbi:MAG: glycosyl transferase family 1, partial [Desulfovibrionaceae bacterium]|nr:glycosyl transferase family 1 [Desulfovibrionaceae bacterium]